MDDGFGVSMLIVIVEVLALPMKIGFGTNVQALPAEQVSVIAPLKVVGPLASIWKVVSVLPIIVGLFAEGVMRLKSAAPTPVRMIDCGLPVALSLIVKAAERLPLAVGVKVTLIVQL